MLFSHETHPPSRIRLRWAGERHESVFGVSFSPRPMSNVPSPAIELGHGTRDLGLGFKERTKKQNCSSWSAATSPDSKDGRGTAFLGCAQIGVARNTACRHTPDCVTPMPCSEKGSLFLVPVGNGCLYRVFLVQLNQFHCLCYSIKS